MEVHFMPFEDEFIIYRPLRAIAFVGNQPLVSYIRDRMTGECGPLQNETDAFLDDIGFWEPDPVMPDPWQPDANHRPTTAVLLMTSACNLRCTYCYAHGGEGPVRQLTFPLAKVIIDTAHENAVAQGRDRFGLVAHGGGEPTANWEVLTQAVEHARQKQLPCEITMSTNGVLAKSKRDFILDNFDGVSLSFDGIREVQDAQRPLPHGAGSFDAVMQTIHAFDDRQFAYGLRLTVTPQFFHTLPRSVQFLCENSLCPSIQVEPAYSAVRGDHADPLKEECDAFIRAFLEAFDVSARYRRTLFYSGARPWSVTTSFCSAANEALIVNPSGKLVTCFEIHDDTHSLSEEFTIGRVTLDSQSPKAALLPILQNSGGRGIGDRGAQVEIDGDSLQRFATKEDERRNACKGCFAFWHCAGDCATRRSASLTKDYGRCHVNREITKELLAHYIAEGDGLWCGEVPMRSRTSDAAPRHPVAESLV